MKLGIIITAYNNEDTLERAIKSVAKLKKFSNKIYIVLVDDCSTDLSLKIANLAHNKKKIDLIHCNKKNLGVSESRNIGIFLCKNTDYLTFLDADDTIDARFFDILNKNQTEGDDLITFNFNYLLNNKKIIKNHFYDNTYVKILRAADIKEYFYKYLTQPNTQSLFTTCWSKIYKTKMLTTNKIIFFNKKLYLNEDTEFVFRCLIKSNKIKHLNFSMYLHKIDNKIEKKSTFGFNIPLIHQISFLSAVRSAKEYLIKKGDKLLNIKKKLDHCIGAYTIIYTIRSCIKILSLADFFKNYLFWKKIYQKKNFRSGIVNYSYKDAGDQASRILPSLIKNKFYFLSIVAAYILFKKRYR